MVLSIIEVDSIPFLTPSKAEAVVSVMEADVVVVENAKVMKKTVVPAKSEDLNVSENEMSATKKKNTPIKFKLWN